jgi:AraC-like DNA-binding protein
MGPSNIAVYDMFQSMLSRSLYAAYLSRNSIRSANDAQLLLRTKKIRSILEQTGVLSGSGNGVYAPHASKASNVLTANAIFDYLLNHLGDPTNLDRISSDLCISKSHLMRKTKALTGYTIQVLHEMLKMERAVLLLERNSNANIAEIAERLGFHNQSYFARVFRKHKGVSPLAWKRRN